MKRRFSKKTILSKIPYVKESIKKILKESEYEEKQLLSEAKVIPLSELMPPDEYKRLESFINQIMGNETKEGHESPDTVEYEEDYVEEPEFSEEEFDELEPEEEFDELGPEEEFDEFDEFEEPEFSEEEMEDVLAEQAEPAVDLDDVDLEEDTEESGDILNSINDAKIKEAINRLDNTPIGKAGRKYLPKGTHYIGDGMFVTAGLENILKILQNESSYSGGKSKKFNKK